VYFAQTFAYYAGIMLDALPPYYAQSMIGLGVDMNWT